MRDTDIIRERVIEIFQGKCVRCLRPFNSVHEIIPKSLTRKWNVIENRILLCMQCHDWAHHRGTKYSKPKLRGFQKLRLEQFYGKDINFSTHARQLYDILQRS